MFYLLLRISITDNSYNSNYFHVKPIKIVEKDLSGIFKILRVNHSSSHPALISVESFEAIFESTEALMPFLMKSSCKSIGLLISFRSDIA